MVTPASVLNVTATLGPFGLAFTASPIASTWLGCDTARGRPFVTGLSVERLTAPLGRRETYEFRVQCGATASAWSTLGPTGLLWSRAHHASAMCPRPASVSGLQVTRSRIPRPLWSEEDAFGFSLLCGPDQFEVEVGGLPEGDEIEETKRRRCPDETYVTAIELNRGFEPHGAYDLYEFRIRCGEMVETNPHAQLGGGAGGQQWGEQWGAAGGGGGGGGRGGADERADSGRGGRGSPAQKQRRGTPLVQRHAADEEADGADAAGAGGARRPMQMGGRESDGGGAAGAEATRGGEGMDADTWAQIEGLLREQKRQREEREQAQVRQKKRADEEAEALSMFGRVRDNAGAAAEAEEEEEAVDMDEETAGAGADAARAEMKAEVVAAEARQAAQKAAAQKAAAQKAAQEEAAAAAAQEEAAAAQQRQQQQREQQQQRQREQEEAALGGRLDAVLEQVYKMRDAEGGGVATDAPGGLEGAVAQAAAEVAEAAPAADEAEAAAGGDVPAAREDYVKVGAGTGGAHPAGADTDPKAAEAEVATEADAEEPAAADDAPRGDAAADALGEAEDAAEEEALEVADAPALE